MSDITVRNNPQENRFEVSVDGEFAGVMDYRIDDGQVLLPRVEVLPEFRGGGVASTLVQKGMDTIREEAWGTVVPLCPYAEVWIRRHPDYQDLVAEAPAS